MNEHKIVSIIALSGVLVIAIAALREHRVSGKHGFRLALSWIAIFLATVLAIWLIQP